MDNNENDWKTPITIAFLSVHNYVRHRLRMHQALCVPGAHDLLVDLRNFSINSHSRTFVNCNAISHRQVLFRHLLIHVSKWIIQDFLHARQQLQLLFGNVYCKRQSGVYLREEIFFKRFLASKEMLTKLMFDYSHWRFLSHFHSHTHNKASFIWN